MCKFLGMGADLFGSFAEATCACLVIGSQSPDLRNAGWGAIMFPLVVSAFGLVVCFVTSFVATHIFPVTTEHRIELALRLQLVLTTLFMIPITVVSIQWLPDKFELIGVAKTFQATRWDGTSPFRLDFQFLTPPSFLLCLCSFCLCVHWCVWRPYHWSGDRVLHLKGVHSCDGTRPQLQDRCSYQHHLWSLPRLQVLHRPYHHLGRPCVRIIRDC